ncbi:MAG: SRPBCC domain-containing protein [Archangium sp.]|nr:SRPBCC domain-containing protein [Archangium sp.]
MKPTDTTDRSQTDTITFEFDLPHAPKKVWRALTDPELLTQWLLPVTGFSLEPGATFTFNTQPQPGWDGAVNCKLLESRELERLSYAWAVGGGLGLNTVVTFTLTPTKAGTRLVLVQSGFKPEQKQNFGGARYGWNLMGGKLIELLGRIS